MCVCACKARAVVNTRVWVARDDDDDDDGDDYCDDDDDENEDGRPCGAF